MSTTYNLVTELDRLAEALAETPGGPAADIPLGSVAERIAKDLGVRNDEVAIMGLVHALEAFAFPRARGAEECWLRAAFQ